MENEPICLNGPHCRQPFCPEHAGNQAFDAIASPDPGPAISISQLDRLELSLFRLAKALRDLGNVQDAWEDNQKLIDIGYMLDKSLRGER